MTAALKRIYKNKLGEYLPGVSDVKDSLDWKNGYVPVKILKSAYALGSVVHGAIEKALSGATMADVELTSTQVLEHGQPALNAIQAAGRFLVEHDITPVFVEQSFSMCSGPGYGGTPDLAAVVDGRRVLVDFKTTSDKSGVPSRLLPSYWCQLAGYAGLLDGGHRLDAETRMPIGGPIVWSPDESWLVFLNKKTPTYAKVKRRRAEMGSMINLFRQLVETKRLAVEAGAWEK